MNRIKLLFKKYIRTRPFGNEFTVDKYIIRYSNNATVEHSEIVEYEKDAALRLFSSLSNMYSSVIIFKVQETFIKK